MAAPQRTTWFARHAPIVYVVGGSGFVGSHLCELLVTENLNVLCIDQGKTGMSYVQHLTTRPSFAIFEHDVTEAFPEHLPQPQYIFHVVGIDEFLGDHELSLQTLLVNALGTHRVMEFAKKTSARILLASSIHVYEGAISSMSLSHYAGPTQQDLDHFTHHEAKRFAEALCANAFVLSGVNARIVRLPEVYGPRMNYGGSGLGKLIGDLKDTGELRIEGDGSELLYPLYVTDAAAGLKSALLDRGTEGNIYHLVPREPTSLIEIAHVIVKLFHPRPIHIRFVAPSGSLSPPLRHYPQPHGLNWQQQVPLEDGLRQTLEPLGIQVTLHEEEPQSPRSTQEKAPVPPQPLVVAKLPTRHRRTMVLTVIALAIFLFVGWSVGRVLGTSFLGDRALGSGEHRSIQAAAAYFGQARAGVEQITPVAALLGLSRSTDNMKHTLRVKEEVALALAHLVSAENSLASVFDELDAPASGSSTERFTQAAVDLDIADHTFGIAEALLTETGSTHLEGMQDLVRLKREAVSRSKTATAILPALFAVNGHKDYLVVVVDTNVPRPGGGVISALGVVTFENGHITETAVSNLAELGPFPVFGPPATLARSGVVSWTVSDALWWGDFPTSAAAARWFFAKATGKETNGVLMVDTVALQTLRTLAGVRGEAEDNDGKTVHQILQKILSTPHDQWNTVGEAVYKLIEEKHLLLASNDPPTQALLSQAALSGALPVPSEFSAPFFVAESADGAQSIQSISRSIHIREDTRIIDRTNISLARNQEKDGEVSGNLIIMMRQDFEPMIVSYKQEAVEQASEVESGWRTLLIPYRISPGETQEVIVESRSVNPGASKDRAFKILQIKQPASPPIPLTLKMSLPETLVPHDVRPTAAVEQGYLTWETSLTSDKAFAVKW